MTKGLINNNKRLVLVLLSFIFITDLAIFLDVPFIRQILGFFFLTILPGVLILQILKLNKIGNTEKFVLSVGLSISFLMFFGLLINNLSLALGYKSPLSTISLLVSFNIAFVVLAIIGYKTNKEPIFSLPHLNLTTSEKAFLIVPILFPALSIFGMHVMNTTDNNIILMLLLFSIPIYVIFVCFFNQKFSDRLYPVAIFLISISLLLMVPLRSNHIIGVDTHTEYYFFQTTLNNLHWGPWGHSTLDACLSISLLPTIYQTILNISPEFLFKILHSLIFSISPLVIYVMSKRYIGESYAFLTSCFFMSQFNFFFTAVHARTNTAILFFALAMMIFFNDKIDPLKKRILFIVFMASCMVSHYSTTYIFFFILLATFVGVGILSKKYTFKKEISLTSVILFFAMIFLWFSQVTGRAFSSGVNFVEKTLSNLNSFFAEELRSDVTHTLFGEGVAQKGIPHKIEFLFTWLMIAFIAIGVITLIRRYKEMSFPELNFKKSDFLKDKMEVTFSVIALACAGLFVAIVITPYLTVGYSLDRAYLFGIVVLSIFFVIGGIILSKQTFKKSLIKNFSFTKKQKEGRKDVMRDRGKNTSQVQAYLIILLVLIPYFLSTTDVTYQLFDFPRYITLNSKGTQYDNWYIFDGEVSSAKWLSEHNADKLRIYADVTGSSRLELAFGHPLYGVVQSYTRDEYVWGGYIYLRRVNIVDGKVYVTSHYKENMTNYVHQFTGRMEIYDNGYSEIWK